MYDTDSEDLEHELHQVKRLLEAKEKNEMAKPSTLLEFVVLLEQVTGMFFMNYLGLPKLQQLLQLVVPFVKEVSLLLN